MFEPAMAYPLKRLALKAAILAACALLQWHSRPLENLSLLFLISGNLSLLLAFVSKTSIFRETIFTYWDEAVVFWCASAFLALLR